MNNENEDQRITDLLRADNEQPPKALDDAILKYAKSSQTENQNVEAKNKKRDWKPWLAAASVVLVMPLLWLMSQNESLIQSKETSVMPQAAPQPSAKSMGTPALEQRNEQRFEQALESAHADFVDDEQEQLNEEDKITVSGSRIKSALDEAQAEPAAYIDQFEQVMEVESQRSITGRMIDHESVEANKALLKDELKAKKRTIKPSNMDPLMALEYAQFGRYLEQGQFDLADQLLTEMQENWPDFDYEDMIYRLAIAEANNSES
ncbi:hypothetical protein OS175_14130 [Marinicella sp. S1101]|uniref:hypothetical protein n=1 Tax=Marinicella marina TaxID=2996016 RepID=UPI00226099D2|nr:hypothetical protein [Marinicella marina]MCX7555010.1 hypothetical protein [Marinicella marina]MDJ1141326.1 hypothetical protein [Marinicella marina]